MRCLGGRLSPCVLLLFFLLTTGQCCREEGSIIKDGACSSGQPAPEIDAQAAHVDPVPEHTDQADVASTLQTSPPDDSSSEYSQNQVFGQGIVPQQEQQQVVTVEDGDNAGAAVERLEAMQHKLSDLFAQLQASKQQADAAQASVRSFERELVALEAALVRVGGSPLGACLLAELRAQPSLISVVDVSGKCLISYLHLHE